MATPAFAAGSYAATGTIGKALQTVAPAGKASGADFGQIVKSFVEQSVQAGQKADQQAMSAVQGKGDLVNVVTAVAESEAAIETLVAVRDRVIQAYEEIMRMPI